MIANILAGALVVASTSFASVRFEDGRTAWLLADGAEVSFRAAGEPVALEARFHRGRGACRDEQARIDVFQDGVLVARLTDEVAGGAGSASVPVAYQGFGVMASVPHGLHLEPGAQTVTLRVTRAGCGVSVTSERRE